MKKSFLLVFIFVLLLSAVSCTIGMGESVDLEAPTILINSPSNNDYVPLKFEIKGVAFDNRDLDSIEVHYTYRETPESEKQTLIKYANTQNKLGGDWSCELEFPFDQEVSITVYAYDKMRNESVDSSDSINVIVDSEAPQSGYFSILRNSGYMVRTTAITKFLGEAGREANKNESENKDNFQNESIVLSCSVQETYEIKDEYLNLYEITEYTSPSVYKKTLLKEKIATDDTSLNPYNPEFTITQEMLTSYSESLATGLHYIMPELIVVDVAGNQSNPTEAEIPLVFAWEAEYDVPKLSFPMYKEEEKLKLPQETSIPVVIFDDDGIKEYKWTLTYVNNLTREGTENVSAKNLRDHTFEIPTGIIAGQNNDQSLPDGEYTLTIYIYDQVYGDEERESVEKNITIPVKITNADAPQINVTSPEANKTPALTSKQYFTIEGEITDNGEVSDIAIAWCKNDSGIKDAEKLFETFKFNADTETDSYKVWNVGPDGDAKQNGNIYTSKFSKEFDIFEINSVTQMVFVIATRDKTENVITQVFRVGAISSLPKFKVEVWSNDNGGGYKVETKSIITRPPDEDVKIKITPIGEDIDIKTFAVNGESTNLDGKEIPITGKKDGDKVEIEYTAENKLGIKNSGSVTIQFEELPVLSGIICNQVGTQIKKDGVLTVQVTFDRDVEVTGTPTLVFDCYKNEADTTKSGTMTLDYASGSGSSSLTFTKRIPEGLEYKKLVLVADSDENWIRGGAIKKGDLIAKRDSVLTDDEKNFKLTIDSKNPEFDAFTGQRDGTTANFTKTDGTVSIVLNFSEPVTAQNGNITIYRKGSEELNTVHTWHIPAVISADVFEKIWNNSSDANRIVLSSSATEKSVNGKDAYGEKTIVSAGPYKMYTNGLKVNDAPIYQYHVDGGNAKKSDTVIHEIGSVMVPDITTKYVLDWQFDTSDTSDTKKTISLADGTANSVSVNEIRAALEAINYHKTTIPLSRLSFKNGNKSAELDVNDSDFIDGIREGVEYILEIPADSFVDEVLNKTAAKTYTFSVGKTAMPVIRVNRWSTNNKVSGVDEGTATNTIAPSGETSGKARVKIDCETSGAKIEYQVTTLTINSDFTTSTPNYQKNLAPLDDEPADFGSAASTETINMSSNKYENINNTSMLAGGTPSFGKSNYTRIVEAKQTYSASSGLTVGDGLSTTGQKIYIVAQATTPSSEIQDLQTSENAYEGAFKTVLYQELTGANQNANGYTENNFKIHACQTPEGVSSTAGWPVTMRLHTHGTPTTSGTRECYKVAYREDGSKYAWMSWELLSDDFFTVTTVTWNFQINIDSLASYGAMIWGYKVDSWGMTVN